MNTEESFLGTRSDMLTLVFGVIASILAVGAIFVAFYLRNPRRMYLNLLMYHSMRALKAIAEGDETLLDENVRLLDLNVADILFAADSDLEAARRSQSSLLDYSNRETQTPPNPPARSLGASQNAYQALGDLLEAASRLLHDINGRQQENGRRQRLE